MKKKSQASIFIILGLIVLFSVGFFIYFKTTFEIDEPDLVSEEMMPIKRYVEECMSQSAEDAVRLISKQGGYLDIPMNVRNNPSRYVSPDGLGLVKIPFWFYKGNIYSPRVSTVERELAEYIKEDVRSCIGDFEAFDTRYDIQEQDEIKVNTFLNKEDISIELDYPLRIYTKGKDTYTDLKKFTTSIDVRLRKIIEVANDLLDSELRSFFLENFTIDLMASNPDIPFTDMEFSCQLKRWHLNSIKDELSNMLYYNLPRIRIKNLDYRPFLQKEPEYERLLDYHLEDIAQGNMPKDVPSDAYEYLHMFWDIKTKKEENINIGFKSIPGVLDLIARPHDNGILRSKLAQGHSKYISFLCVNLWHFVYDVNYPVIVTIRDDKSFDGQGYVFNFAMPVTIHNNEPYKEFYGYDMFQASYFDRGFCEDRRNGITDIRVIGKEEGYTNMEIKEVNLSLQCFRYRCPLGKTSADQGSYRLRLSLPSGCENPYIIAEKEGYLKTKHQIDSTEENIEIPMTKLKDMDYEVIFHRYNSIGEVIESPENFKEDMKASIQLRKDDFYQYKTFPSDEKIQLIDAAADYELELILTQDGEYIGGYKGNFTASASEISSSDKITFHTIKYVPVPFSKEDKMKMMNFIMTGDYKSLLRPELE